MQNKFNLIKTVRTDNSPISSPICWQVKLYDGIWLIVHHFVICQYEGALCQSAGFGFDCFNFKFTSATFIFTDINCFLQSNLYKTLTLGTTQKWSPWAGSSLVKHLYKTTTKQCGHSWQVFRFFSCSNICLNKDLQLDILVTFLKIKNVLSYFSL